MSLQDFLQKKGSLGLLSVLHRQKKLQFTSLEEEVGIAPKTLQRRLDTAVEQNLIQSSREIKRDGSGSAENTPGQNRVQVYKLTEKGFRLTRQMATTGIVSDFHEMRMLQQRIESERDELIEWVDKNYSELAMMGDEFDTPQEKLESIQESRTNEERQEDGGR